MQTFTGYEYLLIDIANQWGLDKELFEARIQWVKDNLADLENLAAQRGHWKEQPLYLKAVQALRKAEQGMATGHRVGFDAVCSGMQLMSAMTGCAAGAKATGLLGSNVRADAYTTCSTHMENLLGRSLPHVRKSVKNATMTALYGSKAEPKKEFGDGTEELEAFWAALEKTAPGAVNLLGVLLSSWNPEALYHSWILPDGYQAYCKVTVKHKARVRVEELDSIRFDYEYTVNEAKDKDVKNAANVVHSIDAYVLRSLLRRCNYDLDRVSWAYNEVLEELMTRAGRTTQSLPQATEGVQHYLDLWKRTTLVDPVILPYLGAQDFSTLPLAFLKSLRRVLESMLEHKPFPVLTVHDEFTCHPNNMNALRRHYRDILADLADSTILDDLLSQLYGEPVSYYKATPDLGERIRAEANYALC